MKIWLGWKNDGGLGSNKAHYGRHFKVHFEGWIEVKETVKPVEPIAVELVEEPLAHEEEVQAIEVEPTLVEATEEQGEPPVLEEKVELVKTKPTTVEAVEESGELTPTREPRSSCQS